MTVRTDNPAHVGMHVFERSGLGKAPFRCIGMTEEVFTLPDGNERAGGCCKYCYTGIRYVFTIRDRDGKTFGVGSDCVAKTGDAGLIKSYKNLPAVREARRLKARALDDRKIAEWKAIMTDEVSRAKLASFTINNWKGEAETWLDFATRAWGYCGASGRARYLKTAKKMLADAKE